MNRPRPATPPDLSTLPTFLRALADLSERCSIVTTRAVQSENGEILLPARLKPTRDQYLALSGVRLQAPLSESLSVEPCITGRVLRTAAEDALNRLPLFGQLAAPPRARHILLEAVESIPLAPPVALHLTIAWQLRASMFDHSVLMALLCAHFEREGGGLLHDVAMAATAGMLHDLGMLYIDPALLAADHRLTGDERKALYAHPVTAAALLHRFHVYPKSVMLAVLEHHERLDGSGYPRSLRAEALSPLSRIVSLAEVVTAMFGSGHSHPEQRVSLLLRINRNRYDSALVASMHRLLRALPPPERVDELPSVSISLQALRHQSTLLTQWIEQVMPLVDALPEAAAIVLSSLTEQIGTLQLMMFEAGITNGQLDQLDAERDNDPGLRVELWALAEEVRWQLRATLNQIRRRWPAGTEPGRFPPTLSTWLDAVDALPSPHDASPK